MRNAFVLMTALPPTTGHLDLIQFACRLKPRYVSVILCTQPDEPYPFERERALREATADMPAVTIKHIHAKMEQNPEAPGFWEMWRDILFKQGMMWDDVIVASEAYGQKLAEVMGVEFFPYDVDRTLNTVKATRVRKAAARPHHFNKVLPEFCKYLQTTVTIFGAESTGKTTLTRLLGQVTGHTTVFEYARPFLELTGRPINRDTMEAIWRGQEALQRQAAAIADDSLIIQDTDLFSTIGYWEMSGWDGLSYAPARMIKEADDLKSDLYIITQSNIPFEADPLRYGGDHREITDDQWIDFCKNYRLPYVVLGASSKMERVHEAWEAIHPILFGKLNSLDYERQHND